MTLQVMWDGIKYETISVFVHAIWSYVWMFVWFLAFGISGRLLSGASMILFLAGNEWTVAAQVHNPTFHAARTVLDYIIVRLCSVYMGDEFCTYPVDSTPEAIEIAQQNCLMNLHIVNHLAIVAEIRYFLSAISAGFNLIEELVRNYMAD